MASRRSSILFWLAGGGLMMIGLIVSLGGGFAVAHTSRNVERFGALFDKVTAEGHQLGQQRPSPMRDQRIAEAYEAQQAMGDNLAEARAYQTMAFILFGGGLVVMVLSGGLLLIAVWRSQT